MSLARRDPWLPEVVRVTSSRRELADTTTLVLPRRTTTGEEPRPGQFYMLGRPGIGEVPISISTIRGDSLSHTVRAVGAVTRALCALRPGEPILVRGPFGSAWPLDRAVGHDVVVLAGGLGLAPLRPVVHALLAERPRFGRVGIAIGARTPRDLLYPREIDAWRRTPGIDVRVTVDRADPGWTGDVGLVTRQIDRLRFLPADTLAMVCGPEVMMVACARELEARGVPRERIFLSLERNMHCAIGFCGHCQLGPHFVCRDGPVLPWSRLVDLLAVREL